MEQYLTSQSLISVLIGISLAACAGFRIFIPLLVSSLAFKFGFISPIEKLAWMGTDSALIIFAAAAIFESLAFLIPWLDHIFDVVAAPLAAVAGMLLASAVLKDMPTSVQVGLGIVAGGGTASMVHATNSLMRLGSTKFTGGLGNPLFSKLETIISSIGSVLAIFIPLVVVMALSVFFWFGYKVIRRSIVKKSPPPMVQ